MIGVALLACSFAAGFGGCTAEVRYRIASTIFDGVPPPRAPSDDEDALVASERAPEPALSSSESAIEVEASPTVLGERAEPEPRYAGYAELEAALPRDTMGNLDFAKAAREGLIRPAPGPSDETPEFPILSYDIRIDPGIPNFEVVFSHETHTYWLRCESCHPSIFQMKAGSNPMSMAQIFEGEFCGRCHGKVAFAPALGCPRCHPKLGG
jgi:c(7)-type cytochrome triheme protein